jgi:general L-amino acid transport system permease protein
MTMAFPLIFVALGRRSNMPAIKTLCTLYVELIRVCR